MTASKCGVSCCGLCQFYVHEGRRGGVCNELNVSVSSKWKACRLAVSPFQSESDDSVSEVPGSEVRMGIKDWDASESAVTDERLPVPANSEKAIASPKITPSKVVLNTRTTRAAKDTV